MKSLTSKIMMIRPANFGFNAQTQSTNTFQNPINPNVDAALITKKTLQEFDEMTAILASYDVNIYIFDDTSFPIKPDAIFSNNWISTHPNLVITYPMFAPNRRDERRNDIIEKIKGIANYSKHIRLESNETHENPMFLEGTGSLVLDRSLAIAYASISQRTDENLVKQWCEIMGYKPIIFMAYGPDNLPIYHTNVMMTLGEGFALVCIDSIDDEDKKRVIETIVDSGRIVISISKEQAFEYFAGNMLQLATSGNEKILVMSQAAYDNLTEPQRLLLLEFNNHLVPCYIPTIEHYGGGSVRCMITELF